MFRTLDDSWTEDFNRAAVLADPQTAAEALTRAKEDEANNIVVDFYAGRRLEERNGHLVPKALREAIRATGPTIRRDLAGSRRVVRHLTCGSQDRDGVRSCIIMTSFDAAFVAARVEQFRDQVTRRLSGNSPRSNFAPIA